MCQWPPSLASFFEPTAFGYIFQPRIFTFTVTDLFGFTLKFVIWISYIPDVFAGCAWAAAVTPMAASATRRTSWRAFRKIPLPSMCGSAQCAARRFSSTRKFLRPDYISAKWSLRRSTISTSWQPGSGHAPMCENRSVCILVQFATRRRDEPPALDSPCGGRRSRLCARRRDRRQNDVVDRPGAALDERHVHCADAEGRPDDPPCHPGPRHGRRPRRRAELRRPP